MGNSPNRNAPIRATPWSHRLLGPYSGHLASRPRLDSASSPSRDCMHAAVVNRKARTYWSVRLPLPISPSQAVMTELPQGPALSAAYENTYLGVSATIYHLPGACDWTGPFPGTLYTAHFLFLLLRIHLYVLQHVDQPRSGLCQLGDYP
ncbi:hypothetical protein CSUI_000686 [Cystoisospora suis]|uniref:Uncharacterized protein n=1 Tax=Cystoisospora suis TaxID=483139 RepID=A0A2C6LFN6_9APIC|nr:hypothetical protein CSUI_000686 [Cystoisospora suis]